MDPLPITPQLKLRVVPGTYGIAQPLHWPNWLPDSGFVSVTRTETEISVVCESCEIPAGVKVEPGWSLLEFEGPFAFDLTGILMSVIQPLGEAAIGIIAVSTYNTDYVLVQQSDLHRAIEVLTQAGHQVQDV